MTAPPWHSELALLAHVIDSVPKGMSVERAVEHVEIVYRNMTPDPRSDVIMFAQALVRLAARFR